MSNGNADVDRADLLRVMGRITALEAIVKMIAGNAFGGLPDEDARVWADDVLRYLGDIKPERELAPDQLLVWFAIKAEAVSSGAKVLQGSLEVAAAIRAHNAGASIDEDGDED